MFNSAPFLQKDDKQLRLAIWITLATIGMSALGGLIMNTYLRTTGAGAKVPPLLEKAMATCHGSYIASMLIVFIVLPMWWDIRDLVARLKD